MGFRATLNFRKFKVALNPMYRICLSFAKSCISFCLSKFHNKKKIHRAEIIPTCSPLIGQFFDTMIVASIDRVVIMTHQNLSLGMCLGKPSCTRVPKTWRLCQHACKTSAHAQGLYSQIGGCECELHNKNACF